MDFLQVLVQKGLLTPQDVEAFGRIVSSGKKSLSELLIEKGISPDDVLSAKGEFFNIPVRKIENGSLPIEVAKYIPEKVVEQYKMLPLALKDGVLEVGVVDPDNLEARDALQFVTAKNNLPFKIFLISEEDFKDVRSSYGGLSGEVNKALSELETELSVDEKEVSDSISELKKEDKVKKGDIKTRIIEDAPVTKIVATVLRYATEGGASDIHIEPMGDKVQVRFRVDGTLHTSLVLPLSVHGAVVARTKILCNMKLDERRKPQDGRFSAHIDGRKIDFRVSTFPAYFGEKVVMRILDSQKGVIPLEQLNLSERNYNLMGKAIQRPYGLILISGPTGSGKTTTLYSMLGMVDKKSMNVLSLEDPVEYNIEGMNQSQVRPEIGYTFATGLRTTLRQDPDVIMVGEIRDKETAGLAIQAALTGHLVFSTIHTNTAAGVIPRLIDMGVDPYLIAPTLVLAIAQRLVKTLCPGAGKQKPIEGSLQLMVEKELSGIPPQIRSSIVVPPHVIEASPTAECPDGTRGRMAVFEVLEMDQDIENIILNNPNESDIFAKAQEKGMLTMRQDALLKAFEGKIPFEEINTL